MEAKACVHCGTIGWGWSPWCRGCGLDEHGQRIPAEMVAAAEARMREAARESAKKCREVAE